MLGFGALPPEINSARMYSGPGSGPLMAAASAWDSLAAQLDSYVAGYTSALSDLQGLWSGGASFTMAAAVAPYVAWATATAAQAEQTAAQARAAAAAFETAFAATVPPAAVAANRIQLAMLVATNFFGQNTPAIAATEAEYAAMWAQDAVAMYVYAASSSVASVLTPFGSPPKTTSAAGQSAQTAAVIQAGGTAAGRTQVTVAELMSALPQQLQVLATGTPTNMAAVNPSAAFPSASTLWTQALTAFNYFDTLVVNPAQPFWSTTYSVFSAGRFGTGSRLLEFQLAKVAANRPALPADALGPGGVRGSVLASAGKAAPVGKLSVPQSWVTAAATGNPTGGPMPLADSAAHTAPEAVNTHPGAATLGGIPRGHSETSGTFVLRNGRRRFQMPRPPYGG